MSEANSMVRISVRQHSQERSELVSFYQSGFQIHSMLCQMALHHLLCSRLVTHPDKNSQALRMHPRCGGQARALRLRLPRSDLSCGGGVAPFVGYSQGAIGLATNGVLFRNTA